MVVQSLSSIPIKIIFKSETIAGELTRITAPRTVHTVAANLPLEGPAMFTNSQTYFKVDLKLGLEKPKREVKAGTIGYWPLGDSICIYLRDSKPYSPVNRIGRTLSDPSCLTNREVGSIIRVERN
jgi:hypothetical protein